MANPVIPVMELARRLCLANHRADLQQPDQQGSVPCSVHKQQAKYWVGLVDPAERRSLDVLVDAATSARA